MGGVSTHNQPEDLLKELRSYPSLAPYTLTLFSCGNALPVTPAPCAQSLHDPLCHEVTRHFLLEQHYSQLDVQQPGVYRHSGGLLCFALPFRWLGGRYVLLADGVRDETLDLWQLSAACRSTSLDLFSLLNHAESLPVSSIEEMERIADEIQKRLAQVTAEERETVSGTASQSPLLAQRLSRSVRVLGMMDEARTMAETISLAAETLGEFFDFPDMVLVLRDDDGQKFSVTGLWGLPTVLDTIPAVKFLAFARGDRLKKCLPFEEMGPLFPAVRARWGACFPLQQGEELFGFLALFDRKLLPADLLQIELITSRVGSRLMQIKKEMEQIQVGGLCRKLSTLTNTLLVANSKEELYQITLGIAADLLGATQGSIMLMDKGGDSLNIVFTKGMSLNVAKCLTLKVGKGIAGSVAKSGTPLLVNDVETDDRVGMANRPRFKSKSLLCIPLKLKDKIIGVLNLSDKKNLSPFTESDLQLLTSFAGLASLIIERYLLMEESCRFEQLSVTDPLTGLYNRRFLQSRLEEELNRSLRQNLNLTVVFIDLDFFKAYNDICGHLEGDQALVKTAGIIKRTLRDMDIVARFGGEEFCAVLPATSKMESIVVAERIRAEVEREKFHGEELMPLGTVTASLGIATFPEDGRSIEALLHASDVALYEAKGRGRNRVVAATPAPVLEDAALRPAPSAPPLAPVAPPLYLASSDGSRKS
ncbi:sensor domain-containing diguanylate cyclase [Geomonas sp. RF6]|uniref:sensor domain-containing diguanylate cyclase n=1 Tax=Geomonas sp. RF6 TaxID=2897342 RepID=UPI001E397B4D|nr:sensor domain-containing diguanylate cyclase [Geomonas sp. RF6]UFS70056.1 sensor domain-containing diguanylate cyclase [Geomonas sp. RF6]